MTRLRAFLFLAVSLVALAISAPVSAQSSVTEVPDYEIWLEAANRADAAVDAGLASDAALDELRSQLAGFRQSFQKIQEENADRIAALQLQLDALGPPPGEGQSEIEEIAVLRERLNTSLDALKAPVIVAQQARSRADSLIQDIDRIARQRQKREFMTRDPSPINPENWREAIEDVQIALRSIWHESVRNWGSALQKEHFQNNLPRFLLFLSVGAFLLHRGRYLAGRLTERLRRLGGRGTGVWTFLASIMRTLLPFLGVVALVQAVQATGFLGFRETLLLDRVPQWAATIFAFVWLSDQIYSKRAEDAPIVMSDADRAAARRYTRLTAVALVLKSAIDLFRQVENVPPVTIAAVSFVPIVFTSLILLRLISLNINALKRAEEDGNEAARRVVGAAWFNPFIRRVSIGFSCAAPVLAALGFTNAAEGLIYPTVLTLALSGAVMALRGFVGSVYALIAGVNAKQASDSLIPVLIGSALSILSLPVLALIWGARVTDLTELWSRFLLGFQIGDSRISPADFLTFAVIFGIGYTATRLVQSTLRNNLLPKTQIDPGGQNAIVSGLGYVGIFIAALVAVSMAGIDLSSLAIVAGALSVGIGFGLQNIVSNFVSGIILLIERPISEGDWIEVGGQMGYVRDISVRSTRIETFDRTDVIVPNSDLVSGTVTNYTRGNTVGRVIAPVGVAYGSDTKKVEKILREIASEHPMILGVPPPTVLFRGFGADSLDFEIRAILRDVNWVMAVHSDMNHEIARRFAEEGIEIPFAQRDVWLRNPETLTGPRGALRPDSEIRDEASNDPV